MQLRASDVDELLEKSSITEIETSLVVLFVEKNNISTMNDYYLFKIHNP